MVKFDYGTSDSGTNGKYDNDDTSSYSYNNHSSNIVIIITTTIVCILVVRIDRSISGTLRSRRTPPKWTEYQ